MPPLIAKWNALKDEDKDLFPLLEVACKFFFAEHSVVITCVIVVPVISGYLSARRLSSLL